MAPNGLGKTMHLLSRLAGGAAAAALIVSAAAPASAREWYGRHNQHHHHDRGPSAGAVIGAVAAFGILAAIASSADKKKREEAERRRGDDAARDRYDDRYEAQRDDGRYPYGDVRSDAPRYDAARPGIGDQDAAIDACVVAARSEASRNGDYAEVRGVASINPRGSGWDVTGSLEQRSSFRANDGWQRHFRCAWQDGRVSGLALD